MTFADAHGEHALALAPRAARAGSRCAGMPRCPAAVMAPSTSTFERRDGRLVIAAGGQVFDAKVVPEGDIRHVFADGGRARLTRIDPLAHAGEVDEHGGRLTAPMSGTVVAVLVKAGDRVDQGAPLVVLEAMKMEHTIAAPPRGRVVAVNFAVGDRVAEGADLVDVDAEDT